MTIDQQDKFNLKWMSLDDTHSMENDDTYDKNLSYPIGDGIGTITTNLLETSHGIHVYKVKNEFEQNPSLDLIKSHFKASFHSETLTVSVAFGNEIKHQEYIPKKQVSFSGRNTLFRHTREQAFDFATRTDKTVSSFGFSIPVESLTLLLGEESAQFLLEKLTIASPPSVTTLAIPLRITNILKAVISPHLKGRMKQLYSQTKVLEYLCELYEYVEHNDVQPYEDEQVIAAEDVYEYLMGFNGDLPSLPELAAWANTSVKHLNTKFKNRFGVTLYRFLTQKRLEEAHLVVENSDLPLKVLAANLGYSHVNHFITAFKRQFGYTPGSLRRKPNQ